MRMKITLQEAPIFVKVLLTLTANLAIGFAMGFMHYVDVGADPITVLIGGLSHLLQVSEGVAASILNVCFFTFVLLFNRQDIKCATVISIFTLGPFMDFALYVIRLFVPIKLHFLQRVVISALASNVMGLAIGFYLFLQIGASPTDAVMRWFHKRFNWEYRYCTWVFYGLAMVVGHILGGTVGIGTILSLYLVGKSCDGMIAFLEKMQN